VHQVFLVSVNAHYMTFPGDILAAVLRLIGSFSVHRSGAPSAISNERVPLDRRVNEVALMRVSLMEEQEVANCGEDNSCQALGESPSFD